ncbi:MAG: hypothetical protein H6907_22175 [Hyphomicrobiales bacterium]|nr:hypothetical protein [Hyphomicrobiales bacterium]
MRRRRAWLATLATLLLAGCVTGGNGGQRLQVISGADSAILFADPDLAGLSPTHWRIEPSDRAFTSYVALWRPRRGQFPQARVEFVRLRPGYRFRSNSRVEQFLSRLHFGAAEPRLVDGARVLRNDIGYVQYHRFALEKVPCVGFLQDWRDPAEQTVRRISGYYCDRDGGDLGEARIKRIAGGVRLRGGQGQRDQAPADEHPLTAAWDTLGQGLTGIALVDGDGRPRRAWFPLPGEAGECRGDGSAAGAEGGGAGSLEVFCTNGRRARLTLRRDDAGGGGGWRAEGRDGDGNRVTLAVTP